MSLRIRYAYRWFLALFTKADTVLALRASHTRQQFRIAELDSHVEVLGQALREEVARVDEFIEANDELADQHAKVCGVVDALLGLSKIPGVK